MTTGKLPPLSPTEWRLMSCIWDLKAASPPQVAEHLRTKLGEELSPKTTGIFLARLEEKGYLRSVPGPAPAGRGRPAHVYEARVTREESLRWQLEKFLDDHLADEASLAWLERLLSQRRQHPTDRLTREISLEAPDGRRHQTSTSTRDGNERPSEEGKIKGKHRRGSRP